MSDDVKRIFDTAYESALSDGVASTALGSGISAVFEAGRMAYAEDLRKKLGKITYEMRSQSSKYTLAHPENTMRVIELLWADAIKAADEIDALIPKETPRG